ncbi:MAG: hypothetical protein OHK0012_12060 [Synechococcales cyanobacterium]
MPKSTVVDHAVLQQRQQALEQDLADLITQYHHQLGQSIPAYVVEQVRQVCTQQEAALFLRLGDPEQRRLVQLVRQLAQALGEELGRHPLGDTLTTLEERVTPYLQASERQLNQLLALVNMGPVTLKLWEAEVGSPPLRTLKAQWQVCQSKLAAVHRQLETAQAKAQVQAAIDKWDQWVAG